MLSTIYTKPVETLLCPFELELFQFLTINNADERAHLVPVLNIILKLSPEENKTLQSVARGGTDSGQSSGWSNLLPMW